MSPEHLHLILNHIPFLGVGVGAIALLVGVVTGSKQATFAGLLSVLLCASFVPAVMASGEAAYEAYAEESEVYGLDEDGLAWARLHYVRAETGAKAIYATALFALIGLLSMKLFTKHTRWLSVLTLAGAVASVAAGIWIASVSGQIRRADFRQGPVPDVEVPEH